MRILLCRYLRPFLVIFLSSFLVVAPVSALMPDDPDYFLQWYSDKINLPAAWEYTTGSPDVVVAVLDTGLDIAHPDLATNVWTNIREVAGDGLDNDHNGYIDDVHGWDFIDKDNDPSPDFSQPYSETAITHGTLVSGLIGAVGNNTRGIAGVAWNVKLMPIRVLDSYGSADIQPTIEGIQYAIDNGADVINLSFQGHFPYPEFREILEKAQQAGIVIVSAAGNGNDLNNGYDLGKTEFFPVCYQTAAGGELVLGVGATDKDNQRATFSNYGNKCLDVMAPGDKIYSTQAYRGPGTDLDAYYSGFWQGTSLSAPIVSGVAALIKSISRGFTPDLVYKFITDTTDSIDTLNPEYVGKLGHGLINAGRAVRLAYEYRQTHPAVGENIPLALSKFYLPNGFVVSARPGNKPEVKIFDYQYREEHKFLAYDEKFLGGVSIATGDINRDNKAEIVTGAGSGGGPHLRVFNQGGDVLEEWLAYATTFHGGVNLAVGDVDNDKHPDIVTAPQSNGGPHIKVFNSDGVLRYQFMAYDAKLRGGWNVAVGDVNLDGLGEIVVTPTKNIAGPLKIFNYKGRLLKEFYPYDSKFKGGVSLAVGDIDGDYRQEIVVGPESVGGPHIKIFDSDGNIKREFFAFYERYYGGVKIAIGDYNIDGFKELATAQAAGDPLVKVFDSFGKEQQSFTGFTAPYVGGANIAIIE